MGTVETGTDIYFGSNEHVRIEADQYVALRRHFINRVVPMGTSRTEPPEDSVGYWLMANVTMVATASYVGAILLTEGYAKRVGLHNIGVIR